MLNMRNNQFTTTPEGDILASGPVVAPEFSLVDGSVVGGGYKKGNSVYIAGNSICHYATSIYGTNRNTRSGSNNTAVTVGTVLYPSYHSPSNFTPIKLTCSVAGTTGSVEPLWTGPGTQVVDGTVVWDISSDTASYTGLPGYFNVANALLRQALRPTFVVGAKSRMWDYIKTILDRQLSTGDDPSIIWLLAPFENDCASANTATSGYPVWESAKEFLDRMIAAGRRVVVQGVHPASTYPTTYGPDCAAYLDTQLERWALQHQNQARFWTAPRDLYLSKVSGETYRPDTATSYLYTGVGLATASDGIHPCGVQHIKLGLDAAEKLGSWLGLDGVSFRDYSPDGPQRFPDPRNLTTGGTINTGITGTGAPGDWSLKRTGAAEAAYTSVARTDGIPGNFIQLDASGVGGDSVTADWKATKSLTSLGLAVGDRIRFACEVGGFDLSARAWIPSLYLTLVGATEGPASVSTMAFSGFGNQMQGQALASTNKLMVYALPYELTIPTGCTGLFVSIKLGGESGAWTGKLVVGRTLLEKIPQ